MEKDNLSTSNLQFSFKPDALVQLWCKTISYYVNNESNVYGLLFDVNYSELCWIEGYVLFTVDCFLICILIKR